MLFMSFFFVFLHPDYGRVAEQSGTGLQNLLKRCDSARDLQNFLMKSIVLQCNRLFL